jgi:hypothetical protein
MTVVEETSADLHEKLDAVTAAHQVERTKLEERHSAAEARWLTEVDRARQLAQEAAKEHERQVKGLHDRMTSVQNDRDRNQQELIEARADLKTAMAVREQLEERLRTTERLPHSESSLAGRSRRKRPGGKSKRPSQRRP